MKKFLSLILTLALVLSVCSFAAADDLPTITIMFHGSNVTDDSAVLEKVNEYIADKVGAKLEVIWGTWGDFDEKAVNALTSGDKDVDMVFTCSWSSDEYNSYAKKGYFLKLDDLIEKYGADLKAAIPESLMQAATIEGAEGKGIYAVNGFKDTATQNTWDVNVTLLNELGYTVDDVKEKPRDSSAGTKSSPRPRKSRATASIPSSWSPWLPSVWSPTPSSLPVTPVPPTSSPCT